jgi:hypothetical protein
MRMRVVVRFEFLPGNDRDTVEAQLALAITVAECRYGQGRVRLGTGYLFSKDGRRLALEAGGEVGEYVIEVFTGLLIREIGEDGFSVERVENVADAARR